jgi:hypothetical protein
MSLAFAYSRSGGEMVDFNAARERLTREFGSPARETQKVRAWEIGSVGVVLQVDQPTREPASYIWLPHPGDGQTIPEIALEYPADAGRHSGTLASSGLGKGNPALKVTVRSTGELDGTIEYIREMAAKRPLPKVGRDLLSSAAMPIHDLANSERVVREKQRRETIPRAVQREVWRRDEGRCVECDSKERLCYDHIIPLSRGGSNTVRNLQLLCERCNLSKGNRI